MSDIVDRLRSWVYTDALYATAREAADEIERLRSLRDEDGKAMGALIEGYQRLQALQIDGATLTASEREAVRFCFTAALPETAKLAGVAGELCRMHGATLRALLERLSKTEGTPPQDAIPFKGSVRVDGTEPAAVTLTDAEREAVGWFARHSNHGMTMRRAATLRGLLDRLSNPPAIGEP